MHKMLKHMKKYAWMLIVIVALLMAQAVCELWLPTYTAAIVDVGIQQEGVEHSTPVAVRKSTLEKLLLWMPDEGSRQLVEAHYAPATPEELRALGVTQTDEPVLALGKVEGDMQAPLDWLFNYALMFHSMLGGQSDLDVGALLAAAGMQTGQTDGTQAAVDVEQAYAALAAMSASDREAAIRVAEEMLATVLPQDTLEQAAIAAVRA